MVRSPWASRKLKKIVESGEIELGRGNVISHLDMQQDHGSYPVYSSSVKNNGVIGQYGKFMFDEELVTWSVDGGGDFFYRPKHRFSVTNVCGYLRIHTEKYIYRYLYYLLDWQHRRKTFDYTDKAHPSVIVNQYDVFDIPPEEQTIIADILDTLDDAIHQTQQLIEKLKNVRAGLLHDLLTYGIDENGDLRDPVRHPEQFKESKLGLIPRDWDVCTIGDSGSWRGGSTPSKSLDGYWRDGKYLWVTPKDIIASQISITQDKVTIQAITNSSLHLFEPNHMVIVFRSGILRHSLPIAIVGNEFTVNQDMKVLIPDSSVSTEFMFVALQKLQHIILTLAVKSGTTVESIDTKTFMNIRFGLPKRPEQDAITAILIENASLIEHEELYLEKAKQLRRGLSDDLLTGKVRVIDLLEDND